MTADISDAIKILNAACNRLDDPPASAESAYALYKLIHAVRYLANPDRYERPKYGPSAVKTGRTRSGTATVRKAVDRINFW